MSSESIYIHDTLTGTKRPLELLEPGSCRVYCCGPTVYDLSHIGHARSALLPDILVRLLRHEGLTVKYARNVTDIDDRIILRANERGEDHKAFADRFATAYREDLRALGLDDPTIEPQVTEHIAEIIAMIQVLIDKGMAYPIDSDVYYSVKAFTDYGKLSKRNLDDLQAGARVDVDERKHHPADFALWKSAKPGEPAWDSPWGPGRPGWHIECSAMATKHLGPTFDIHTGGQDLIFPHHENEIAQSQGCHGTHTYARYWMHNGFVQLAGEKMSKSLGNFFTIREVTALYHPEVLRFFLLLVHYRRGMNFDVEVTCEQCNATLTSEDQQRAVCSSCGHVTTVEQLRQRVRFPGLEEADERVTSIYETLLNVECWLETNNITDDGGSVAAEVSNMLERVLEQLRDDLNSAAAIAELSEPLSLVNRWLVSGKGIDKAERRRTIARFMTDFKTVAALLGTFARDPLTYLNERRDFKAERIGLDTSRVEALLNERNEARQAKNWARADEIRDELTAMGVKLRDGQSRGTQWTL